jgi:hypothetical protein
VIDRKSLSNPFNSSIVTSPVQAVPADVPEIHRESFELCRQAYDLVVRERFSLSVLLSGDAGCGKTHLLSRFRRWLSGEMDRPPFLAPASLIAIRMETAPSQIWRYIRQRFAEDLTRRSADGKCALDVILVRFAALHSGNLRRALEDAEINDLGLDLTKVLVQFGAGNQRRLCRAWLAGDGLSDADLQLLNLPLVRPEEVEEEIAEANARRMVLAITRMSAPSPVVFCFDQVEALGIAQQGNSSFAPFSRMGTALIDGCPNVLVISTILETARVDLQNGSMVSDYQRIGKIVAALHPLNLKEGRALIDSRLGLIPELQAEDPIPENGLRAIYEQQHGSCNARRLIHESRRLFTEWQGCAPPPFVSTPEFLRTEFERLWTNAEVRTSPEMADAILDHALPAALEMLGKKATSADTGLTIEDGGSRVDAVFINHSNLSSLASTLKRLLKKKTPGTQLCLIRDQRLPISAGAKVTRELLKKIEDAGGRVIRVEKDALAALDAMRKLLTAATSGDLSSNGETVEAKTVREWLAKNLPPEVERLAAELLGEAAAPQLDARAEALLELVGRRKLVSVDEAAQATSWPKEKIEGYARTHPLDIRWFGGSCPVVCLAVASASTTETDDAG